MERIIEGTPHITLADAAELLATTHLRVLMLLKHKVVTGSMVDGEWYVDKNSLDCLKSHGLNRLEQASCPDLLRRFDLRLQGGVSMDIVIKPSDLYYKYPKDTVHRHETKFRGKPDSAPFNRDDLYEVIPMFEQVMNELGRDDARTLHAVEELMIRDLPRFISTREEVFDFLVGCAREILEAR